ncbi:MAG: helix-turn-helix domain-containing protein [Acidobacteriia bacterium]|nr:helix-turn-helix domain-containing protein [Terriglobia bacterium]
MAKKVLQLEALVAALDSERQAKEISWRQLAAEAGVSPSTLTRMQQGKSPDVNTFSALTTWLNIPAERFYTESGAQPMQNDPMAVVSTLLRGTKKMSPKAVAALTELVNAAVKLSKELK